mgnify:CR=1 FL=1
MVVVNVYADGPSRTSHFMGRSAGERICFTSKWYTDYNPNAQQPHFYDDQNDRDMVPEDVLMDIGGDEDR